MILDTSFLVDLMNGDREAIEEARELDQSGLKQRIPTIVLYELYVGVGKTDMARKEVQKIDRIVESRAIEALDARISKLAGRIDGTLRREGNRVASHNVIIGATARCYDEDVVTGNPDDFRKLPGVTVRTYRD